MTWTLFIVLAYLTCHVVWNLPANANSKGEGGVPVLIALVAVRGIVALALIAATLLVGGAL